MMSIIPFPPMLLAPRTARVALAGSLRDDK